MSRAVLEPTSPPAPTSPSPEARDARPWGPTWLPAALSVAGGVALWLAFPGIGWWWLAPGGVALLALVTRGRRPWTAAGLGGLFGVAFFVPTLSWSGEYVGRLPWLALAGLEAAFMVPMAAGLAVVQRPRLPGWLQVVGIAGLWVAQEAARSWLPFGGFPWSRLAFSQASAPSLGWAVLGGAPLTGFMIAAAGASLALAVSAGLRGAAVGLRGAAVGLRGAAVGLGAAVLLLLLPAAWLGALAAPADARTVQVAAIQGNVPQAGLEFNAQRRAVLDNHASATEALAQLIHDGTAARPGLVVWPENASDIDPLRNPDAAQVIQQAADAVGVPVLLGAVLSSPPGHLSNTAIVWQPTSAGGGPGARYTKRHPAPFGEYIPLRSFFRLFSSKVDLVREDFVAGDRVGLLRVGPAKVGDVICFEVAYDDLVRDTVTAGADLLVVQTNNATFGRSDESVQQLAMSRLRAVEHGRAVVHISTVGVSALIMPDGRVVARSGLFTRDVLQARLPLLTSTTVADRVGALPEWLAGLAGLVLVGVGITGRRAR